MDQTRVTSGYDVEVALGGRYLQYLLLLGVETGEIPIETTFTLGSGDEIKVEMLVPPSVNFDRTYPLDNGAPTPAEWVNDDAFAVEVLDGAGPDLKVTLFVRLTRGTQVANADINLHLNITLDSELDSDGIGLGSMTLNLELLDIDGSIVTVAESQTPPVTKADLLARLQPLINRGLSLNGLGTGGRIAAIHMKKLPADPEREAALGLYVNLILRAGPQVDNVLGARGVLAQAQNILEPGSDVTFATRSTIYGDFAADAYHRMAERKGSGYHHPVKKAGEKLFDVVEIEARPALFNPNQLQVSVEGEYEINNLPDPNFTVHIFVRESLDADGIMDWASDAEVEASILADILLGVIALATVPLFGPYSVLVFMALEAGKYITEKVIAEVYVEEKADKKVDAALLDVAPNRLTIARRRWDPLFTTNHQIGLRPGEALINAQGLALWGKTAITRATEPAKGVIIREAIRDADGKTTHLVYRVRGLVGAEYLGALAPGMHRGSTTQPDPADPDLFQISVPDAVARVLASEIDGSEIYEVQGIEFREGKVENMLVLSRREIGELRNSLVEPVRAAAQVDAEAQDSVIRAAVVADFGAQGIIPTDEQIDAEVAVRKQAIVDEAVKAYEDGALADDLAEAKEELAQFELSPNEFGRLQTAGLLRIADYELVEIGNAERYYYRDRYDREDEETLAARLADNLHSKPKYHHSPSGPVFA